MLKDVLAFTQGCEAIDFQIRSKLYNDLVNIFQMGFEFRNTIDIGMVSNRGEVAIRNFRAMEMCNYVKKFLMPEFTKVVYMHTGLTVSKVQVHTDVNAGPIGMFAVDLSFGDVIAALGTMDRITGVSRNKLSKSMQEFMEVSKNFDTTTGKITNNKYGTDKKISVKMYFDALYAYCLHDFMSKHLVEPLTASELAAVMLHEIGHALTVVERAGDYYFQQRRLTEHLNYVKQNEDVVDIVEDIYPVLKAGLKELVKNKDLNGKHIAFLNRALDTVKKATDSLQDIPPDTSITIISAIKMILKTLIMAIASMVLVFYQFTLICKLGAEMTASMRLSESFRVDKTSDTFSTAHNLRFMERMADEFVSRHGASAPLASGLSKLFKGYLSIGSIDSVTIRESFIFSLYFKLIGTIFRMIFGIIPNYTYEENYERLKRIAQNAITPLKQNDIPTWLRKDLIEDYELVLATTKDYKGIWDTDCMKSFEYLLSCFFNPTMIIRNVTTGNLRRDYEKLSDKIDELMNNKLYYQANKILSLVGK